ncbi:MAG: flavodoxin family protein [Prevotella sp.]|nr:flavodoxin family protein [Prevotella sp.]
MERKVKALFINGSPRKNKNTAQLLLKAMEGAESAGAEVEMVNLYDRNLNYKGCMSCFACKLKGGRKGVCSFKDDLQPILEKAVQADVLICGSPNYCSYPTAMLRAFMERLVFPAVNYSDYSKPIILKKLHSATIYTMNCPNEDVYRKANYHILMDTQARQLGMFGPTEILCSYDTYQFVDYSKYDAASFNEAHKAEVRDKRFPKDLQKAFELGKRLVEESKDDA